MKLFSRLMRQTNLLTKQLPDSSELPQPTFEALLPKRVFKKLAVADETGLPWRAWNPENLIRPT